MTELRFIQIDAFADRPFTGNPAAVMPLDAWLPDETLQAIALENNLSETAFTIPDESGAADYELRWFTPTLEVALCGHATLASGHVLLGDMERIRFRTRKSGILELARDGDGYAMSLPAYTPAPKALPWVISGLGAAPVETLWHDEWYAMVITSPSAASDVVSRVFVPGAGIDEDPVTGSAHSVLVPYWAARLGRSHAMTFFQASKRGGHLTGRLDGDRVILGGCCVTVIEGTMRI